MTPQAMDILTAIRNELGQAADVLLGAAESSLSAIAAAKRGEASALDQVEQGLGTILEACSFHDLTSQRLSALEAELGGAPHSEDSLLNGPALPGRGLDQAAADALFD
jgi:hypothetical protein